MIKSCAWSQPTGVVCALIEAVFHAGCTTGLLRSDKPQEALGEISVQWRTYFAWRSVRKCSRSLCWAADGRESRVSAAGVRLGRVGERGRGCAGPELLGERGVPGCTDTAGGTRGSGLHRHSGWNAGFRAAQTQRVERGVPGCTDTAGGTRGSWLHRHSRWNTGFRAAQTQRVERGVPGCTDTAGGTRGSGLHRHSGWNAGFRAAQTQRVERGVPGCTDTAGGTRGSGLHRHSGWNAGFRAAQTQRVERGVPGCTDTAGGTRGSGLHRHSGWNAGFRAAQTQRVERGVPELGWRSGRCLAQLAGAGQAQLRAALQ
nr:vegetative incompatibility protein HET-E-1-like [Columba livia]